MAVRLFTVLLYVAGLVAAQSSISTYTSDNCLTSYGQTSSLASVPTSWNTTRTRRQAFARGTSTRLSTLTPPAVTSTSTSLITRTLFVTLSGSQETDTATIRRTSTVSSIVSSVSTFTTVLALNSTTTITATTTIPTQSGFTPAAADVVSQGGLPSRHKRWQPKYPRYENLSDLDALAPRNSSRCKFSHDPIFQSLALFPPQVPTAVYCDREVRVETTQIFWKTASGISTVTAQPSTITATTTSTTTKTSSVGSSHVDASTTITVLTSTTITTTTTSVSTVSSTITNTVTVNAPAATVWAACAANNTVTRVNGQPILYGIQDLLVQLTTDSATQCCETCQTLANCTTSAYYIDGGNCLLGNATGADVNLFYTTTVDTDDIFVVSNGDGDPKGDWVWEGPVNGLSKRY